ncbi:MAG: MFS transporter [Lachnospiraceae bacterium]|nr:MFS transporter [Lachnospiraceae bacterium]
MKEQMRESELSEGLPGGQEKTYFAVVTLFWISMYVNIPFQTPYLKSLGTASGTIGLIVGAYGITQVLLRVPVGVFADKIGRHKKIMSAGCLASFCACLIRSVFCTAAGFFIANLFSGVAAGMWISFFVYYTSKFSSEHQQTATSRVMIFFNGGILLGFVISTLCYPILGMARMCVIGVFASFAGFILTLMIREKAAEPSDRSVPELLSVCCGRRIIIFSVIALLQQGIQMSTTMSFTNQYIKSCGASDTVVGFSSIIYMLSAVFFAGLASRGACKKRGGRFWIPLIFCIVAVYCTLVPRIRFVPLLLIAQVFPGMSQGFLLTLATSEAMVGVPREKRSTAMGFFNAVYAVGLTVFPMFTGAVIASAGMSGGYMLLAAIALASAVLAAVHYRLAPAENH